MIFEVYVECANPTRIWAGSNLTTRDEEEDRMWRVHASSSIVGLVVVAVVVALGHSLDKTGTHEEILVLSDALGEFYADC